jgi:hypothetical protein
VKQPEFRRKNVREILASGCVCRQVQILVKWDKNNLNSAAKFFVIFLQVCVCRQVQILVKWDKITDTSPEDPSPIRTICIILVNVFVMVAMVSIFSHSYCKFTSVVLGTVAICVTKFERKNLPILVQIEQNNFLYISDLLILTFMAVKLFGTQDGV